VKCPSVASQPIHFKEKTIMVQTLLTALAAVVAALKVVPGVTGEVATWISVIENAVTNAVAAHAKAQQAVDPTLLKPVDPV
jgi:hypothetical protein